MKRILLLFFVSTMGLAVSTIGLAVDDDPNFPVPNAEEIRAEMAPLREEFDPALFRALEGFALDPRVLEAAHREMRAMPPAVRRAFAYPEGNPEHPDTMDDEKTD